MIRKIVIIACALCVSACSGNTTYKNNRGLKGSFPSMNLPSSFIAISGYHLSEYSFINPLSSSSSSSDSSLSASSSNSESISPVIEDYFFSDMYGPFPLGAPDFNATFTYELNTVSSQTILERIRLLNNSNSVVASSTKAKIDYVSHTRNSVTFLVPIHDYWSENGLTLKFEILSYLDHSIIKEYSATFYPPSNATISGERLKRERYQSRSLGFYGDGKNMKEIVEIMDFRYLGDYLNVENYYRLNLSNNSFKYPNDYAFDYESIYLRFIDNERLFPFYTHSANNEIIIPLKVIKDNEDVSFSFNRRFYINKKTLQVSDVFHQEYAITDDFYLPINGLKAFNDKRLYLDLNRFGLDQITTSIPLKYDVSRALVSVCTDGEYCVEGGNK